MTTSDEFIMMSTKDHKDALKLSEETSNNDYELKVEKPEQGEPIVDKYEQAGIAFDQLHKIYKNVAYNMRKKNSPARVLEHLLFSPAIEIKIFGQEEQDLLAICRNVLKNKVMLMEYTAKRMADEKELANELEEESKNVTD